MPYGRFKAESKSSKLRLIIWIVFFSFPAGDISTSSMVLGSTTVSLITCNISHLREFFMKASLNQMFLNAMMSSYRGMIIRTTHMTGILTGIGFKFGSRLSGRPIDAFKLTLPFIILMTFLAGCCAGYVLMMHFGIRHFYIIDILCLAAGALYFMTKTLKLR